jgi:hypothetical protein
MAQQALWRLAILTLWFIGAISITAAAEVVGTDPHLLFGNRVLLGTVAEIRSDQAKIDIDQGEPRYIPMNVRKAKGLPDLTPWQDMFLFEDQQLRALMRLYQRRFVMNKVPV